jgi:hypothetical protein
MELNLFKVGNPDIKEPVTSFGDPSLWDTSGMALVEPLAEELDPASAGPEPIVMEAQGAQDVAEVEVAGYIFDQNGQPLFATVSLRVPGYSFDPASNVSSYIVTLNGTLVDAATVTFSADGYQSLTIGVAALMDRAGADPNYRADVTLAKASSISGPLMGLALLGFAAWALDRKKKVGAIATKDVFPWLIVAGGVIAFSVVRKILIALGIWDDKDDKDLDQASTDSEAFWNPNFWRNVLPAGKSYTYVVDTATAISYSDQIWDATGAFNDCEECIIGVFKLMRTQANASYLCYVFQQRYGEDLLTFLRGGIWPQDRLSDADVNTINRFVNSLPQY